MDGRAGLCGTRGVHGVIGLHPYPRTAAARGLIRALRKGPLALYGRSLLYYRLSAVKRGRCVWCRQACAPRSGWHNACSEAYRLARGEVTTGLTGKPLVRGWTGWGSMLCAHCGKTPKSIEFDHRVPLAVARELAKRGDRRWWRAWTRDNLQGLCRACHQTKTCDDMAWLRTLRNQGNPSLSLDL